MKEYHLAANERRAVIGTDDDFSELGCNPRPETGFAHIATVVAENWKEARSKLADEGFLVGLT